jgi:hypothetical protein
MTVPGEYTGKKGFYDSPDHWVNPRQGSVRYQTKFMHVPIACIGNGVVAGLKRLGVLQPGAAARPSYRWITFLAAALGFLGFAAASWAQPNGVYREVYAGLSGSSMRSLTNDPNFPNFPYLTEILTNSFETPAKYMDLYGQRLRALVVPPVTGTYVFWVAADDNGALWLSTDESPVNKGLIGYVSNVVYNSWYTQLPQQSTNIYLEAGRRYYIEALHAAGIGIRDFASVAWKLPGGTLEQPIPDVRLRPFGMPATTAPLLTSQPNNLTVVENATAFFRVGISNLDVVNYQWQRNGSNLLGAIGATYTLAAAATNDTGASFRCVVSNSFGVVTSAVATLTVLPDTAPPLLSSAANLASNTVQVFFNEPVELASGTNLTNYAINNGITIVAAASGPSPRVINLTTSPLARGSNYVLTVSNVRDQAVARNTIAANSQQAFTALLKGVFFEVFTNIPSSYISDLTNSPTFPNSPSSGLLATNVFEAPSLGLNNYGERWRARLLAPVTGTYTFWIAANDSGALFLGTNDTPASARQIASVTTATPVAARQWDVQPNQRSATIPLVAGQQYYIEALVQDGVSNDFPPEHLAVRWQLPDGTIEEPIPAARLAAYGLNLPLVVAQPANATVVEGGAASFAVTLSNVDPVSFQWQQNGTNLPGATNAIYTDPLVQYAENGSTFRCLLANALGSTNSLVATLTVTHDVTPPALVNVFNSGSNQVVVFFSKPLEALSATNAANYHLGGALVTTASWGTDNRSVALSTTPLVLGSNYTLTVNGVRDRAATPNTIAPDSSWTFLAAPFMPQDIGSPPVPGAILFADNGVTVAGSGTGCSGTNDQFNFSWQQRRGDFDVVVRVQRLEFGDLWSLAGLMVREDLGTNSRYAGVFSTPTIAGTFFQYRTNAGSAAQMTGTFPVNYPYTWLRLQRFNGNRFNGFASLDGQTWTQLGTVYLTLPATVYLGFAVASHNPSQTVGAQFRDFGDTSSGTVGFLPVNTEPPGPSSRLTGLAITEIMYHPAPRLDGRSLEYVEVFNSNPFAQDISGYRLSGDIDYTFPPGTVLQGGAFLVVAHAPADMVAVYGIPNVTGPYSKHLSNQSGTVRLRNQMDAIVLEVEYDSKPPWPLAPDGTGHSLFLARPSYGESSPKAWDQSDTIGGSPGTVDSIAWEPARNVVINEFLAHVDLPEVDFIELYNHSRVAVDLSGCWLSDDPATNKFRIPDGTIIAPTGFVYFTETTLGFALNGSGEGLYLVNSNRTRVLDCFLFDAQEKGVSMGRFPDGAPTFQRLSTRTPGGPNARPRWHDIVINEIMYNPISGDDNDQFVELYNRGSNAVSLANWAFTSGLSFVFPASAVIPSNGYVVVAKNVAHLLANYTNLNVNNTFGDFGGTLAHGGERIALALPEYIPTTNNGVVTTNIHNIVVDELTYCKGGQWGKWSDAGGSSLELIDPHSDNRLPSNWADSDDTAKSVWTTVTATGLLDIGADIPGWQNSLQIYSPEGPAECLVDNVYVSVNGSVNLVTNSTFEAQGLTNWVMQGDHRDSYLATNGDASARSLHIVAADRGDNTANRIYTILMSKYTSNMNGTITARVKWLHGWPEILLRLRCGYLEAFGTLAVPSNLGTPGARNSRYVTNAGPALCDVAHSPVAPAASQDVVVTARVQDPDGVASVQLIYRIDPFGQTVTVPMTDDGTGGDAVPGDGVYSATIPGQPGDTMVAFYVQATDAASRPATTRFPNNAPTRECLVRFGEEQPSLNYGTYRLWLTQANLNKWLTYEKLANYPYDAVIAYGNCRVIYNAAAHYASSPAHTLDYDSPIGTLANYQFIVPEDDPFLNDNSMRIEKPGNGGLDPTCQLENLAYWMAGQMSLPNSYFRPINVYVNGVHRLPIFTDAQKEGHTYDLQWFPDSDPGDLYKVGFWQEFDDTATDRTVIRPSLQAFRTAGGTLDLTAYRIGFAKRALQGSANDYSNLFDLIEALNTTATGDAYAHQVGSLLDFSEWARAWALERIINNTDLYGSLMTKAGGAGKVGGQNCYMFKPANDTWKFLLWDVQAGFTGHATDSLFNFTDPPMSNLFNQPVMLRRYWQALADGVDEVLDPAKTSAFLDSRYAAYLANGINVTAPDNFKTFISIRRDYILWLLSGVRSDFAITSNNGFTNATTLVTLSGTAPISARTITINGAAYPLSWTSVSNWSINLPLSGPTNQFVVQGYDAQGNALTNGARSVTVYFNGSVSRPEDSLVINEIMYTPAVSNASYVEIYNRSTNTTFDLLNYRLHGVDFNFTPGTILGPQSYLLVVQDKAAFQAAYGTNAVIAGEFNGNLDPHGESLTLIKQAATTNETDVVIDRVKYDNLAPWPAAPAVTNSGVALQLIDSAQDNARVSNWGDGSGWQFFTYTGIPGGSRLYLWLDGASDVYLDDLRLVLGTVPAVGSNFVRNGDFESSLGSAWSFAGSSGANTSTVATTNAHSGTNSLHLIFTKLGGTSACLYQDISPSPSTSSNYTLSFWYRPTTSATNLTVRLGGSAFSPVLYLRPVVATPGASNSIAGTVTPYPLLWLNEVQPNNPNGLRDNTDTPQPWLELFNSGTNTLLLDGLCLSRTFTNLNQWAFPTGSFILPGQFRVIFADGQPQLSTGATLHTSFRLDPTNGSVALSRGQQILDYIHYTNMNPGMSYGSWPDGQLFDRQLFYYVTPGASNNPAPVPVAINEWMASNTRTLVNPATGKYDDWFELYNFGSVPISLAGYYLTSNLKSPKTWCIPSGTTIAPQGFLLCWADNDKTNNNTTGNALHTSFALSKKGEAIGLFSPDGVQVDAVTFGAQNNDVSQGRYPDGNVGGVLYFMTVPTPRTNNLVTNNLYAPVLAAIPSVAVNEGSLLVFTAHATDSDVPVQTLTYSLLAGAPDGASIDPLTGVFAWMPLESQGGASYPMTVQVTDNGGPSLSDTKSFTVTVNKVNTPPVIGAIVGQTVDPGTLVSLTIPATDSDLPPQTLTYAMLAGPAGAGVNPASGLFTWTPSQGQAASTNIITVSATDNGVPPLSATQTFAVTVNAVNPCTGYMADVAPRVGGNGAVTIADWVQVGRFAAGLADISNACEFAKADCAPKPYGNGVITISDWVQAGRYAAGLDPLIAPPNLQKSGLIQVSLNESAGVSSPKDVTRAVVVTNMVVEQGQSNWVQILLEAQGNENALGFSLSFDPDLLTFVAARAGSNASDAYLNFNKKTLGRVGLALALSPDQAFDPGLQTIAEVCFRATAGIGPILTPVSVVGQPIPCEIVDADVQTLPATYRDGAVVISSGTAVAFAGSATLQDGRLVLRFIGAAGAVSELQRSSDLEHWDTISILTNRTGLVEYIDNPPAGPGPQFYRTLLH